jgi:hypothetical protein
MHNSRGEREQSPEKRVPIGWSSSEALSPSTWGPQRGPLWIASRRGVPCDVKKALGSLVLYECRSHLL